KIGVPNWKSSGSTTSVSPATGVEDQKRVSSSASSAGTESSTRALSTTAGSPGSAVGKMNTSRPRPIDGISTPAVSSAGGGCAPTTSPKKSPSESPTSALAAASNSIGSALATGAAVTIRSDRKNR